MDPSDPRDSSPGKDSMITSNIDHNQNQIKSYNLLQKINKAQRHNSIQIADTLNMGHNNRHSSSNKRRTESTRERTNIDRVRVSRKISSRSTRRSKDEKHEALATINKNINAGTASSNGKVIFFGGNWNWKNGIEKILSPALESFAESGLAI